MAGRPPARRRLLAPVLPGRRRRAGQARRQRHRLRGGRRVAPLAAHRGPGLPRGPVAGHRRRHRLRARPPDPAGRDPLGPPRRRHAVVVRPAHRLVVHLPQPPLRHRRGRPSWATSAPTGIAAASRLAHVIRTEPDAFAPKHRWAMDWYYPVLCGVLTGEAGRERLTSRQAVFFMEDRGVRCVSDRPWITVGGDLRVRDGPPRRRRPRHGPRPVPLGPAVPRATAAATGPASCSPRGCTSPAASSRPTPRRRSSWPPTPSTARGPAAQLFADHDSLLPALSVPAS